MFEHLAVPIEIVSELAYPVVPNFGGDPDKPFIAACDVTFRYGHHEMVVPKGFEFDGASVPRWIWWIHGFAPWERDTLLAALIHDYLCEHPEELPRIIADAIFCATLGPVVFRGRGLEGAGPKRRLAMYLAVRAHSMSIGKG